MPVSRHEIHASWTLLAAVVGFCICWIPPATVRALQDMMYLPVPPFWLSFSTLFGGFSGWINPVAYGVMNRVMRKEFLKVLRRQKEN